MKTDQLKIFGIRHHGAGSARNVVAALQQYCPDIVLVECPAEAEHLIPFIDDRFLIPPVAILIYNRNQHQQHVYYPFTVFSPEWQAILYANNQEIPARFFDLPQGQSFKLSESRVKKLDGVIRDPFAILADAAGMSDSERWWDQYIEQYKHGADVFETVLDLMSELRQNVSHEYRINEIREAYMRQQIRRAQKEGFKRIAVVCGAWHAPALYPHENKSPNEDKRILQGLKKVPTKCTWVPWSYNRIARHSGYGSGVISPYWYEALFLHKDKATVHWMSRAASIMKTMAIDVSPSHVIEATRLASSLSAVRRQHRPGIEELFEALTAVFCFGDEDLISELRIKIIEGESVGSVSNDIPAVPLLQDLEERIKKARLTKDWRQHDALEKHLDLRKHTQLLASQLLHQMLLLDIPWGTELEPENDPHGTFHEYWELHWIPDYEMDIIEASMWGNTVREAASAMVYGAITRDEKLSSLGNMLLQALRGNLPELIAPITRKLSNVANVSQDLQDLMPLVVPLIWSLRYGSTHKMDVKGLKDLLDQLIPRICLLLPGQAAIVGEELAEDLFNHLMAIDQGLKLLQDENHIEHWHRALSKVAYGKLSHPLLKGASMRELLNTGEKQLSSVSKWLNLELSSLEDPFFPAQILEGFLYGGASVLLHHQEIRLVIDHWITSVTEEHFNSFLPILRRIFSRFSKGEKEVLFQLIKKGEQPDDHQIAKNYNAERENILLPVLDRLFEG